MKGFSADGNSQELFLIYWKVSFIFLTKFFRTCRWRGNRTSIKTVNKSFKEFSFLNFIQFQQREYNEEEPARTKKITPSISDLLKKLIVVLVNKNVLTQTRKKNVRKKRHKTDLSQIFFSALSTRKILFRFSFQNTILNFQIFGFLESGF